MLRSALVCAMVLALRRLCDADVKHCEPVLALVPGRKTRSLLKNQRSIDKKSIPYFEMKTCLCVLCLVEGLYVESTMFTV